MIEDALIFATEKHAGQKRKDGTPYIYHPMAVAMLVKLAGYDEKYQTTALLHDVLEDTDATVEEVARFGDDVLSAVELLTKKHENFDEVEYVNGILKNELATVVKSADKVQNLYEAVSGMPGQKRDPEQKQFAKQYIKNAKLFYKGKFCKAVDRAIGYASLCYGTVEYPEWDMPFTTAKELTPYSVLKERNNQYLLKRRKERIETPDLEKATLFQCDSIYYCAYSDENKKFTKVWRLSEAGWLPTEFNLWANLEDTEFYTLDQMKSTINYLNNTGYFIVDVNDL